MIPQLSRIMIRNFKSIGFANVEMRPFMILVGPNGAGKSNFIDAMAFVSDCLNDGVDSALGTRGGLSAVRRNSISHPTDISVALLIRFDEDRVARYAFTIKSITKEEFKISEEKCSLSESLKEIANYERIEGKLRVSVEGLKPSIRNDRLLLPVIGSHEIFAPIYDFLTTMRFYSLIPQAIRTLHERDQGLFLRSDGSNAAAVLNRLMRDSVDGDENGDYQRLCRLLARVVAGIERVGHKPLGKYETIFFKQDIGSKFPFYFDALNMSDGTLRVLGILLALTQPGQHSLIAIEEPESTVHPAVAEMLVQVLKDTSNYRQIIVTTHSPEILEQEGLTVEDILHVSNIKNNTKIAPLSQESAQIVREQLYSLGDLQRINELRPDINAWPESQTGDLFKKLG